jgi:SulP family sulfate permease
VTLLLLTGLFEMLPEATLAAVVIAAVMELVDVPALRRLYRVYSRRLARAYGVAARPDFIGAIAALLGVTVFDTLPGLFIGIATSLIVLLYWSSRPRVAELGRVPGTDQWADVEQHPENEILPGVVVVRVDSGLYFANSDWVRTHLRRAAARPGTKAVVLDGGTAPFLDVTSAEMLGAAVDDLRRRGVRLVLARDIGEVRDVLRRSDVAPQLQRTYRTVQDAVDAVQAGAPRPVSP